jgi:DNA-binding HxlR family transcriptional regulator
MSQLREEMHASRESCFKQLSFAKLSRMLGNDYKGLNCSVARTLELVGERWSILVLRDVFLGLRRFDEMQRDLGLARNVLAARLDRLVSEGILEKVPYQQRPARHEYRLTEKGLDLWPVIVELMQWGDRYAAPAAGPPIVIRHKDCGGVLGERRICTRCGQPLGVRDVRGEAGPGASQPDGGPGVSLAEAGSGESLAEAGSGALLPDGGPEASLAEAGPGALLVEAGPGALAAAEPARSAEQAPTDRSLTGP